MQFAHRSQSHHHHDHIEDPRLYKAAHMLFAFSQCTHTSQRANQCHPIPRAGRIPSCAWHKNRVVRIRTAEEIRDIDCNRKLDNYCNQYGRVVGTMKYPATWLTIEMFQDKQRLKVRTSCVTLYDFTPVGATES